MSSTPSTIPGYIEGQYAEVPTESYAQAISQGFKPGVTVTSPEGRKAVVPSDQAGKVVKQPGFALGPPEQQPKTKMFSDKGEYAEVPNNAVPFGLQNGWKPGVDMTSPLGHSVPLPPDLAETAKKVGWGTGTPDTQPKPGFLASALGSMMGMNRDDVAHSRFESSPLGQRAKAIQDQRLATNPRDVTDPRPDRLQAAKDLGIDPAHLQKLDDLEAKAEKGVPWEDQLAEKFPVIGSQVRAAVKAVKPTPKGQQPISGVERGGHALAAALPFVGPMAEGSGEALGQGDVKSGLGQAAFAALPFLAHAAPEVAPRSEPTSTPTLTMGERAKSAGVRLLSGGNTGQERPLEPAAGPGTHADVADYAASKGIELTPAQATQSKPLKAIQAVGERAVVGGKPLQDVLARQHGQVAAAVEELHNRVGNPYTPDAEAVGEHLQSQANEKLDQLRTPLQESLADLKTTASDLNSAEDVGTHLQNQAAQKMAGLKDQAAKDYQAWREGTKGQDFDVDLSGVADKYQRRLTESAEALKNVPGEYAGPVKSMLQKVADVRSDLPRPEATPVVRNQTAQQMRSAYLDIARDRSGNVPTKVQALASEIASDLSDAMDSSANKAGVGEAWKNANQTYRHLMETYNDKNSPLAKVVGQENPSRVTSQVLQKGRFGGDAQTLQALQKEGFDLSGVKGQVLREFEANGGNLDKLGYGDDFLRQLFNPDELGKLKELHQGFQDLASHPLNKLATGEPQAVTARVLAKGRFGGNSRNIRQLSQGGFDLSPLRHQVVSDIAGQNFKLTNGGNGLGGYQLPFLKELFEPQDLTELMHLGRVARATKFELNPSGTSNVMEALGQMASVAKAKSPSLLGAGAGFALGGPVGAAIGAGGAEGLVPAAAARFSSNPRNLQRALGRPVLEGRQLERGSATPEDLDEQLRAQFQKTSAKDTDFSTQARTELFPGRTDLTPPELSRVMQHAQELKASTQAPAAKPRGLGYKPEDLSNLPDFLRNVEPRELSPAEEKLAYGQARQSQLKRQITEAADPEEKQALQRQLDFVQGQRGSGTPENVDDLAIAKLGISRFAKDYQHLTSNEQLAAARDQLDATFDNGDLSNREYEERLGAIEDRIRALKGLKPFDPTGFERGSAKPEDVERLPMLVAQGKASVAAEPMSQHVSQLNDWVDQYLVKGRLRDPESRSGAGVAMGLRDSQPDKLLVARGPDQEPVGYAGVGKADGPYLNLEHLVVRPDLLADDARLKGVGTQLMRSVASQAADQGKGLSLYPSKTAEGFYQRLGLTRLKGERTMVLSPENTKALASQRGSGSMDDINRQLESAPTFYSRLEQVAQEKLPAKFSGDQALATLRNAGVRGDELNTVTPFLQGKNEVTKAQLLDHVKGSNLASQVQDVWKREDEASDENASGPLDEHLWDKSYDAALDQADLTDHYDRISKELYGKPYEQLLKDHRQAPLTEPERANYEKWARLDHSDRVRLGVQDEYADLVNRNSGFAPEVEKVHEAADNDEQAQAAIDDLAHEIYEDRDGEYGIHGNAKYVEHQLPGGENYRELLLQLPEKQNEALKRLQQWEQDHGAPHSVYDNRIGGAAKYERWKDGLNMADTNAYEKLKDAWHQENSQMAGPFSSSHWDEPNVLGHIRMNDRTDVNGKKTLFLEELQSDWHQQGRRNGYQGGKLSDEEAKTWADMKYPSLPDALRRNINGRWWDSASEQDRLDTVRTYLGHNVSGVPDAPFKKDWHELLLKRALREAAESGADQLAWTPGDVQNERYDLSKHVKSLQYFKDKDGNFHIDADPVGNGARITQGPITPEKLDSYVGKDVAQKIINGEGYGVPQFKARKELSGTDLKVGGAGMRGFYDKLVPDFLNRYGKKWGVKVGSTELKTTKGEPNRQLSVRSADNGRTYQVWDDDKNEAISKNHGMMEAQNIKQALEKESGYKTIKQSVPVLPIAPKMRQDILRGQPISDLMPGTKPGLPMTNRPPAGQEGQLPWA